MADDMTDEIETVAIVSDDLNAHEIIDDDEEPKVDLTSFDQDSPNLVEFFDAAGEEGKKFLKDLGDQVCQDFTSAWDSSEEYREKREENFKIMVGIMGKKDKPFEGCANAHAPLMLERLLRLISNVYAEIFTSKDDIFVVPPSGPDDQQRADLLTRHGNWQIKNDMMDFSAQQQRGLWEFFGAGSVFAYSYYDTVRRRNRHDILNCEEFVIPYVYTTVMPDLSDVPFKIRILRKYKPELEYLRDENDWANLDAVIKAGPGEQTETPVRDQGAAADGILAPDDNPNSPYEFLHYAGNTTFPGTNYERPIEAIVDKASKVVVKLTVREEDDWKDVVRFERQSEEWELFKQDMQQYEAVVARTNEMRERLRFALVNPGLNPIDPMEVQQIQRALEVEMMPPVRPLWMDDDHVTTGPDLVRRVPLEMFSHGRCIENPLGSLGLSYGNILAEENRMANEALNRFYDAATLSNVWSLLTTDNITIGDGDVPFGPGMIKKVKNSAGGDLRSQIMELKPAPANGQLVDIARMAADWGDGVTVSGIVSGEPGKSGETYRGVATRLERATKQLSVAASKYMDFLGNILRNNAKLNRIFLDEDEVFHVTDDMGLPQTKTIGRKLYQRDYSVSFSADVRFSSQAQKVAEADEILAMIGNIPPLQGNKALLYAALKEAFVARGKKELVPLLGPPPPPPTTTFGEPEPQPQQAQPMPGGGSPATPPPGAIPSGPPQPAGAPRGMAQG